MPGCPLPDPVHWLASYCVVLRPLTRFDPPEPCVPPTRCPDNFLCTVLLPLADDPSCFSAYCAIQFPLPAPSLLSVMTYRSHRISPAL
jgi:hypothetical protein